MTKTAEPLATGPFHGFFHEGATLYHLHPAVLAGGPTKRGIKYQEVSHIIVSAMDRDDAGNPAEVVVFAANSEGVVDGTFYLTHGAVLELPGTSDPDVALTRLGYIGLSRLG